MAFNVGSIGSGVARLFSVLANARAVQNQAKVTGGAMNTSVHCSIQSVRDSQQQRRQESLIGHYDNIDAACALEPAHTATGEDSHSPTERRDYLHRRRRSRDGHQQRGEGRDEHHAPAYLNAEPSRG